MDLEPTNANHSDIPSGIQKSNINIIEQMNALNRRMQNPSNDIYKKSASWDQQNTQNNKNIEIMLKEMMHYITKIDAALTKTDTALTNIETALSEIKNTKNIKSEGKGGTKSFWDNFRA